MTTVLPDTIDADYFDGISARARQVRLKIAGGALHIDGEGVALQLPLAQVLWPERTRHGVRIAHLRVGGSVQGLDEADWDAWVRTAGVKESPVVKAQQNWRATAVAMLLLLALAAAAYLWGVPWAARGVLALVPPGVDRSIGETALQSLDRHWLLPSQIPEARQQRLRVALANAVAQPFPVGQHPIYELRIHTSPNAGVEPAAETRLGANAFALPGGVIVVTDELMQLLQGRDDVMLGVLGHELGHVRQRHAMRLLIQASLLGVAAGDAGP